MSAGTPVMSIVPAVVMAMGLAERTRIADFLSFVVNDAPSTEIVVDSDGIPPQPATNESSTLMPRPVVVSTVRSLIDTLSAVVWIQME